METKSKNLNGVKTKKETQKKLSKAGQWMQKHKGGIGIVTDWKAVNK
jgi:hypothetical protein